VAVLRPEANWDDEQPPRAPGDVPEADPIASFLDLAAAGSASLVAVSPSLPPGVQPGDPPRELDPDERTETLYPDAATDKPGWHVRLFGSHEFFRLWIVQVISATGDWLGFARGHCPLHDGTAGPDSYRPREIA